MQTTSGLKYEVSKDFGPYEIRLPDGAHFLTALDLKEMSESLSQMLINTAPLILSFIHSEYAEGRTYTFRELRHELGIRNGIEPDSAWLKRKLMEMAERSEFKLRHQDGALKIIPTGVLSPEEALDQWAVRR